MDRLYSAGDDFGYSLGLAGGILVASLMLYSLRKRYGRFASIGTVAHWFDYHVVAGIGGTVLVLFHSTFRYASVIGLLALASTVLVALTGIVGRFGRGSLRTVIWHWRTAHIALMLLFAITSLAHIVAVHMY